MARCLARFDPDARPDYTHTCDLPGGHERPDHHCPLCGSWWIPAHVIHRDDTPRPAAQVAAVQALLGYYRKVSPNAILPASEVQAALDTGHMPPLTPGRKGQTEVQPAGATTT